jgi:hypothetical protein
VLVAATVAGCASQPFTIADDDDALCHYSQMADSGNSYAHCRAKLESQRASINVASASRIEGYALLQGPAQPTGVADDCKTSNDPKTCPSGDVTGTIPAVKTPAPPNH